MLHFTATEPFDRFTRRLINDAGEHPGHLIRLAGTAGLHAMALGLNWDAWGPSEMLELAQRPDTSRATVLLLYWRNCAGYYLQYADRSEVPDFELEGFDLVEALQRVFEGKPDGSDGIGFDPRADDGVDRTTIYKKPPRRRASPAHMLQAVPGTERKLPMCSDWYGRPPTGAERDVVAAGIARGRALLPGLAPDAAGRDVILAVAKAMGEGTVGDDVAWLWLDQLGWDWECSEDETDGVVFGVSRGPVTLLVPDIVRNTQKAGTDPARIVEIFDMLHAPWDDDGQEQVVDLVRYEFPFAEVDPMA